MNLKLSKVQFEEKRNNTSIKPPTLQVKKQVGVFLLFLSI